MECVIVIILCIVIIVSRIKIGNCCADCKNLHKCWSRIDNNAYDHPACKYFEIKKGVER